MTAFNSKEGHEKLAIAVCVLQNMLNLIVPRCCLQGTVKKCSKIQNARAEPLFC